jgi:hypothetical protein
MVRWPNRVTIEKAADEINILFKQEDWKDEIKRVLALLAQEEDPRTPKPDSNLQVDEVMYDAPRCFRVKVARYGMRIIFRLLLVKKETSEIFELSTQHPIPKDIEGYIDVVQIGFRDVVYGEELRRRYLSNRFPPYDDI